jgi:hypothetical protein
MQENDVLKKETRIRKWSRVLAFIFGLLIMFGAVLLVERLTSPVIGHKSVQLMFADFGYTALVPVDREIQRELWHRDPLAALVRALMDGPMDNDSLPVIPPGTKLHAIFRADDIAYIDFGQELFLGLAEEAEAETLAVYGLVNTITHNISEIRRVQILIDGAPRATLRGLSRIAQALTPRRDLEK